MLANSEFAGSYLNMGYLEQRTANLERAWDYYENVLEPDPDNAHALNNLGYLNLLSLNLADSVQYLNRAYSLSPSLVTARNLGDAYLFLGDFYQALQWHTFALEVLSEPGIENERYPGGPLLFNFMPLERGDRDTIQYWAQAGSMVQKQAVLRYRLSLDHALNGDFVAADQALETARGMDASHQYSTFFVFRISSMLNMLEMPDNVRGWLESWQNLLQLD